MRKAFKQIFLGTVILAVLCAICTYAFFSQFALYVPLYTEDGSGELRVEVENPDVLRAGEPEYRTGYVRIPVYPAGRGTSDVTVVTPDGTERLYPMRVDGFRTVFDLSTGNYTGDTTVLFGVTLFWLMVCAIMLWRFFQAKGPAFYDYGTVYYAGFSLFAFANSLVMLSNTISHLAHPESYSMLSVYAAICGASVRYMMLTTPLMIAFAAAMAVSNIALLRHERPRPQNALGLLISALLLIGEGIGWYLFSRDLMLSEWQGRLDSALQNTYATMFIYCQCMLTGAVICGVKAARNNPAPDKDFIIILGCWFRPDGTLPPLLRSRAERALDFWQAQKEQTGKEACFVPSGGQGSNEPMAEAEAIRQFLLSRGVEDRLILPETRSVNTLQNMDFSRQIIREAAPEGKTVFATSSYHVFRSGLWARQAGLPAEGIGSKTKWWFWPNAFMRETAGLLQKRWKQEVLFMLLLIAFFDLLSMVL